MSDVTKLDEIQVLLSDPVNPGQGNNTTERITNAVDKICDLFRNTAKDVFLLHDKTKTRIKGKQSDQVWFSNTCHDKRKSFHKAKNRYSFIKNKENRDAMKKAGKEYKCEMNKCYKKFQHKLESDLRKMIRKSFRKF